MLFRAAIFAAAAVAATLSLSACGDEDDSPGPAAAGDPTGPAPAPSDGSDPAIGADAQSPAPGAGSGGQNTTPGASSGDQNGTPGAGDQNGTAGGGGEDQSPAPGAGDGEPDSGAPGGAGTVAATFETVELVITEAPCFGAGCHNDDQNPLDLRLDDQLYTRMTSLTSTNCGDIPIINPGNPEASALVKILKGPCGPTPRMPIGCIDDQDAACIPAEYITAIEQWIAEGAPPQ